MRRLALGAEEEGHMLEAALWSAVATGTLLIGMVLAYRGLVGPRWTALIMIRVSLVPVFGTKTTA